MRRGRDGARRPCRGARARVRLRRRAPALRGDDGQRAAARPGARSVFGEGSAGATACSRCSARSSSYTATLATRRPLVLCVDDLQWSDTASLRFVAYLARRIAALPVLVATTIRTGEPDSDELLLGELGQDPATVAVQPRPLTADGTAGLVSDLLGEADERVRRRLPAGHGRQPAAAAPAADGAGRRAGRARRRARRRPCARSARARSRAPSCCGSAGCPRPPRRSRGRSRCWASSRGCRRSPALAEVDEASRGRGDRSARAGRDPARGGAARLRAPARPRRDLRRAARRAARARARPRRAAAGVDSARRPSGSPRS